MPSEREALGERMRVFREACKRAGVKMTPQRMEVFRELACTEEHPDVETISTRVRRRMPNVSLDTVYRTLSLFEEMGLIRKVEILCDRARYDANTDLHHHFVCMVCGAVHDFYSQEADTFTAPDNVLSLGDVESSHIQVRGVCSECKAKVNRKSDKS